MDRVKISRPLRAFRRGLDRWLECSDPDQDLARRGWLLNILLLVFMVGALALPLLDVLAIATGLVPAGPSDALFLVASVVTIPAIFLLHELNRRRHIRLASALFILLMLLGTMIADTPDQVVSGRTTIVFGLPVFVASLLLGPAATFPVAVLSGVLLLAVGVLGAVPGVLLASIPFEFSMLLILAIMVWLTVRSLDQALTNLRRANLDLDQRVQARTRELTDALEQRKRLQAMVSHDLRAPDVSILGLAEMLLAGVYGPLTAGQSPVVGRIAVNARHQLSLINDLLDRAQIEAGKVLSIHPTVFSPTALLDDLKSAVGDQATAKHLALTTQIGAELPAQITGDPQRLLQILTNLVMNAIKFTQQGQVRIVLARPAAGCWQLSVSDTGSGLPVEVQAHLFEDFQKEGHNSGAGLGLAIVHHLVEQMNGRIEMATVPGQGSTFTIILPWAETLAKSAN